MFESGRHFVLISSASLNKQYERNVTTSTPSYYQTWCLEVMQEWPSHFLKLKDV
jgi:hypothetical protein